MHRGFGRAREHFPGSGWTAASSEESARVGVVTLAILTREISGLGAAPIVVLAGTTEPAGKTGEVLARRRDFVCVGTRLEHH